MKRISRQEPSGWKENGGKSGAFALPQNLQFCDNALVRANSKATLNPNIRRMAAIPAKRQQTALQLFKYSNCIWMT